MSIAEKLTQIAENQEKVYDAGKQAEHDRFWDVLQKNGTRTTYNQAFTGYWCDPDVFYPKYDILPVGSVHGMFYNLNNGKTFDLSARLEECGVVLDTGEVTDFTNMFSYAMDITRIPEIDMRKATNASSVFANMYGKLKTIDKIIVSETTPISNWFSSTTGLEDITFDGVIGSDIDFSNCYMLTTTSVRSISDHLADLTGKTAQTLTFHKDVYDKLTEVQMATIAAKNWTVVRAA